MIKSLLTTVALSAALALGAVTPQSAQVMPLGTTAVSGHELAISGTTAGSLASRATESALFKYWNSNILGGALGFTGTQPGDIIIQVAEMPYETVMQFADLDISALYLCTPYDYQIYESTGGRTAVNPVAEARLVIYEDLSKAPVYTQTVELGNQGLNIVGFELDEPYKLKAGTSVYFGYQFTLKAEHSTCGYIMYCNDSGSPYGGNFTVERNGQLSGWNNVSDSGLGNLMLAAEIQGENMPSFIANVVAVESALPVEAGTPFSFDIAVENTGVNTVESVEVAYTIGDANGTAVVEFDEALPFMSTGVAVVEGVVATQTGKEVPLVAKVTKVNGEANRAPEVNEASTTVIVIPQGTGFSRRVVFEEATGIWCGWCPGGYLLMEDLRNQYSDDKVIPIAVHCTQGTGIDPMNCTTYKSWVQKYISGFPSYTVNRNPGAIGLMTNRDYNWDVAQSMIEYYTSAPAVGSVEIVAEKESVSKMSVTATTRFAIEGNYRLAFVVKEDSVGPYNQASYYAKNNIPGFGVFSEKETVSCLFNDVARIIDSWGGISGSVPADVKPGEVYTYTRSVNVASVKNKSKFDIVALLLNYTTGVIENATVYHYDVNSGVEDAIAPSDDVAVSGENGAIRIAGDYARAEVYTTSGMLVTVATGEETVEVPAGLYIVKVGDTAAKVIVR